MCQEVARTHRPHPALIYYADNMLRIISGLCCVAMAAANTPMLHQDTLKDVAERSLAALAACDQTLSGAYVTPTGHLVDFQSLFK